MSSWVWPSKVRLSSSARSKSAAPAKTGLDRSDRCRHAPQPVVHRVVDPGLLGARAEELHELPEGGGSEDQPLVLAHPGETAVEELGTLLAPVAAPVAVGPVLTAASERAIAFDVVRPVAAPR